MTWQLGIVADRAGRVHLGAVVAGTAAEPTQYVDLLAPVGADVVGTDGCQQLGAVLVRGEQLGDHEVKVNRPVTRHSCSWNWRTLVRRAIALAAPSRRTEWITTVRGRFEAE